MQTINFTTEPQLMTIKRHRLPKIKNADGQMIHQESDEQYAKVPETNVVAYFHFKDVPLDKFIHGVAMRGLRLEAQGVWRTDHPADELTEWLRSQPRETHKGAEYYRVDVNVAELAAETPRARVAKPVTAETVMRDIGRLSQDEALKALQAMKESNPMFAAMVAQAFGR